MCEHQDKKKIVMHSKPCIKIIGILLLIVTLVKSSDWTIIQIIRKNKSILRFLINPSNCFTWNILKFVQVFKLRKVSGLSMTIFISPYLTSDSSNSPQLKYLTFVCITPHFPHLHHSVTLWRVLSFSRVLGISCISSKQTSFTPKLTYWNPTTDVLLK